MNNQGLVKMENKTERKPQINLSAKPEFIEEIKKVADILEIPAAQFIREATKEKIAELKKTNPLILEKLSEEIAVIA